MFWTKNNADTKQNIQFAQSLFVLNKSSFYFQSLHNPKLKTNYETFFCD